MSTGSSSNAEPADSRATAKHSLILSVNLRPAPRCVRSQTHRHTIVARLPTLRAHEAKAEQSELDVRQRTVVWREQVFVVEISHYGLSPSVQQLPRVLAVLRYVLHTQERPNPTPVSIGVAIAVFVHETVKQWVPEEAMPSRAASQAGQTDPTPCCCPIVLSPPCKRRPRSV